MNRSTPRPEASCQICQTAHRAALRRAMVVRPAMARLIEREVGHWDENGWICLDDLEKCQHPYVQSLLEAERGELTGLELEVLKGLREHETVTKNPEAQFEAELTFGQRLADRIAAFGGSWAFLVVFAVILCGWMAVNSYILVRRPFDPFPTSC